MEYDFTMSYALLLLALVLLAGYLLSVALEFRGKYRHYRRRTLKAERIIEIDSIPEDEFWRLVDEQEDDEVYPEYDLAARNGDGDG